MIDQPSNGGKASKDDAVGSPANAGSPPVTAIDIDVLVKRASIFHDGGHFEPAFQLAMEVATRRPDHIEALLVVANSLRDLGRFDDAIKVLRRIGKLQPGHQRAHAAYALTLFYMEDWARAWRAFDVRFKLMEKPPQVTGRGPDGKPRLIPPWREGPVPAHVLVMSEQGLGDTIQFVRFLPLLREAGAQVTCVVPHGLFRLLKPLDPDIDFRPLERADSVPGVKGWTPLMHLPQALGLTPDRFVPKLPYLQAEPELVARRRAEIGPHGFKVGIVWQGNPDPRIDIGRSAPLAAFAPLAEIPGVRLISLQKGNGLEQRDKVPFAVEVLEEFDAGPDRFIDTAAAMTCLDLVVTIDTSVAHLAGALGVPTIILLKRVGADWRWLFKRDDTVWYPSVRLFRQRAPQDWTELLQRVAAEVQLRAQQQAKPPPKKPPKKKR
jgi:hypothetical protein